MSTANKVPGAKLSKRTNRKQNLKKFIASNYTDIPAFLNACKGDENLLIYTCITRHELEEYIEKIKTLPTLDAQIKYLVENQPMMNTNIERYEKCISSIASYLKNYIQYNGFKMANSDGDYEDWTSEFWLKYTKICNFYRDRWFYREKLKKESTVVYSPMQYKEFIYICRMSITGERKHQAFLATQNPESSLFKTSLDFKIDTKGDTDKSLLDVVTDHKNSEDKMVTDTNLTTIIDKALELSKLYDNGQYTDKIAEFYWYQDTQYEKQIGTTTQDGKQVPVFKKVNFDKKTVILGKIFLYKAGLVSPKILAFIKSLSATYKAKFNISSALVNAQIAQLKKQKVAKILTKEQLYERPDGYEAYILRKRGTL